ncbi:MAG TPA: chromate transporter [Burkholderiales bacterium]|jgi:chromate transporter|nr:chromate transporter [Burkholderiales bacterium]
MPQPTSVPDEKVPSRIGPLALFFAFNEIAVSGFGGTLPWSYRTLVETRRWLTDREFMEMLSLGQLLPGPNICNVGIMVGWRFAGYGGAAASLAGLVVMPFVFMVVLGFLYVRYGDTRLAQQALNGMSAVAAGLVLATGVKMLSSLPRRWLPALFGVVAFAGVGLLRLPLLGVLLVLAPAAIALAWRALR